MWYSQPKKRNAPKLTYLLVLSVCLHALLVGALCSIGSYQKPVCLSLQGSRVGSAAICFITKKRRGYVKQPSAKSGEAVVQAVQTVPTPVQAPVQAPEPLVVPAVEAVQPVVPKVEKTVCAEPPSVPVKAKVVKKEQIIATSVVPVRSSSSLIKTYSTILRPKKGAAAADRPQPKEPEAPAPIPPVPPVVPKKVEAPKEPIKHVEQLPMEPKPALVAQVASETTPIASPGVIVLGAEERDGASHDPGDSGVLLAWQVRMQKELIALLEIPRGFEQHEPLLVTVGVDAQGQGRLLHEEGCPIPVVRAAVHKALLSYSYPPEQRGKSVQFAAA